MDSAGITAKVKETINAIAGIEIEGIADSASYKEDLGLDSLAILEIEIVLEKEFGFTLENEELAKIQTVQDTSNLIIQRASAPVTLGTSNWCPEPAERALSMENISNDLDRRIDTGLVNGRQ